MAACRGLPPRRDHLDRLAGGQAGHHGSPRLTPRRRSGRRSRRGRSHPGCARRRRRPPPGPRRITRDEVESKGMRSGRSRGLFVTTNGRRRWLLRSSGSPICRRASAVTRTRWGPGWRSRAGTGRSCFRPEATGHGDKRQRPAVDPRRTLKGDAALVPLFSIWALKTTGRPGPHPGATSRSAPARDRLASRRCRRSTLPEVGGQVGLERRQGARVLALHRRAANLVELLAQLGEEAPGALGIGLQAREHGLVQDLERYVGEAPRLGLLPLEDRVGGPVEVRGVRSRRLLARVPRGRQLADVRHQQAQVPAQRSAAARRAERIGGRETPAGAGQVGGRDRAHALVEVREPVVARAADRVSVVRSPTPSVAGSGRLMVWTIPTSSSQNSSS